MFMYSFTSEINLYFPVISCPNGDLIVDDRKPYNLKNVTKERGFCLEFEWEFDVKVSSLQ